jgi:hypothetical protein
MYLRIFTSKQGNLSLLLVLLFIISSVAILLGYFTVSWKKQMKERHQCRLSALSSLQILSDGMNEVVSMNPSAIKLQLKQRKAEAMIKRAKNPKLIAAALAYYKIVKIEQAILRKKQLQIIQTTLSKSNLNLSNEIRKNDFIAYSKIVFLLKPYPANSDSPIYVPYPGIEKEQTLRISWNKKLSIHTSQQNLKGQCLATTTKENKWHPVVITDKL